MENPDLVLQETGSRPTYSRLNYVPSGDTLRQDAISSFYPTALKGCRGIVFTHGVWMGGRASGRAAGEIVCPGCISETVRCRKLILGRDIG